MLLFLSHDIFHLINLIMTKQLKNKKASEDMFLQSQHEGGGCGRKEVKSGKCRFESLKQFGIFGSYESKSMSVQIICVDCADNSRKHGVCLHLRITAPFACM